LGISEQHLLPEGNAFCFNLALSIPGTLKSFSLGRKIVLIRFDLWGTLSILNDFGNRDFWFVTQLAHKGDTTC